MGLYSGVVVDQLQSFVIRANEATVGVLINFKPMALPYAQLHFPWRMLVESQCQRLTIRRQGITIIQSDTRTTHKQFGGNSVLGVIRRQIRNKLLSSGFRSSVG